MDSWGKWREFVAVHFDQMSHENFTQRNSSVPSRRVTQTIRSATLFR